MFVEDPDPVLVFKARMASDNPDDRSRDFVIRYYLKNKTLDVFENKKTGVPGGKFLSRSRVKDPKTGKEYDDDAFYIGSLLQLSGRTFELVEGADYTIAFMESKIKAFPRSDVQFSVDCLSDYLLKKGIDLAVKIEEKRPGQPPKTKDVEEILYSFAPDVPKQCSVTLIRRFSDGEKFDADQFLAHVYF